MTFHQQIATELERCRAQVLGAIQGLDDDQISVPGIDGWSVRDHLAHLTVWDEMRFFEVSRIARGGRASFPATEEQELAWINERTVEMRRHLPVSQVLADLDFARAMVLEMLAACPEDRLDLDLYEEISLQGAAAHDLEHAGIIRGWREKEGI